MRLTIDSNSGVPPFEQVRSSIAEQVNSGELPVGAKLPTVRGLGRRPGDMVNTVAKAYRELEQAGLIETRGRAGTLSAAPVARAIAEQRPPQPSTPARCTPWASAATRRWPSSKQPCPEPALPCSTADRSARRCRARRRSRGKARAAGNGGNRSPADVDRATSRARRRTARDRRTRDPPRPRTPVAATPAPRCSVWTPLTHTCAPHCCSSGTKACTARTWAPRWIPPNAPLEPGLRPTGRCHPSSRSSRSSAAAPRNPCRPVRRPSSPSSARFSLASSSPVSSTVTGSSSRSQPGPMSSHARTRARPPPGPDRALGSRSAPP